MSEVVHVAQWLTLLCLTVGVVMFAPLRRWWRARKSTRGRSRIRIKTKAGPRPDKRSLRWGNSWLPWSSATQHFLASGASGSGKSHVLMLLLREPMTWIGPGTNTRAIFFDTKQDVVSHLQHFGVTAPVYSLNPFEASRESVRSVAWDIAKDVTSPSRALNLASSLVPKTGNESQPFFTNAPRGVVNEVIKSFIRHSGGEWTYSDLGYALLSRLTTEEILRRDAPGRRVLGSCLPKGQTGDSVFSTVYSNLLYHEPVAALWKRLGRHERLSIREWINGESIVTLGANADAKVSLNALNEQLFEVVTNEIDLQRDSTSRRTWVVLDETRLSGSLLKSGLLPFLAVKGRSKGVSLVLAIQDIEGLRDAAGERLANEIVAQMSHKAFLRMNSHLTSTWASQEVGEFDTVEYHTSDSSGLTQSISGHYSGKRDAVLPSEFRAIKQPNPTRGVTGYFLSSEFEPYRGIIPAEDIAPNVLSDSKRVEYQIQYRPESDQWLRDWTDGDCLRLGLEGDLKRGGESRENEREQTKKRKGRLALHRSRGRGLDELQVPVVWEGLGS